MKYFLVAGERSGDLHGSNLIKSIKKVDQNADFQCWGGDQMQAAGARLLTHYREIAVMGIWEVIVKLFAILEHIKNCHEDILDYQPDVVILIDFGGFNMKLAKRLKASGITVHYYISPKIWAWNTSRAHKIRKYVDKMMVILPFEEEFYQRFQYKVDYVGNPVVDAVSSFIPDPTFLQKYDLDKNFIALLPGSRKQEVLKMLPLMLRLAREFKDLQFAVAAVRNLDEEIYSECSGIQNVRLVYEENYNLLHNAKAAVVTSGTATLETGLFNVPQMVVYKASWFSYAIGSRLVKVPFISLVNLIVGEEVVKEFIQKDYNLNNLSTEMEHLLDEEYRNKIFNGYKKLQLILGNEVASDRAARMIYGNTLQS